MSRLTFSVGVNAVLLVMACVVYSCRDSQSGSLSLQLVARARMRMPTPTVPSLQRAGLGLKSLACQQARSSVSRQIGVHGTYKVTLDTPTGSHQIECPDDMYILDKAELDGIALPFSCRAGFCISCAGIMQEGTVDQSDQTFLTPQQMDDGIVLTCFARPTSDMRVKTHVEHELEVPS
mmetsp:Transcript_2616/g.4830  ORF Transcript_2616/g.4830 Transcript_2616/m.4830 type:complete len:178 (-) Transcript_2616:230-763(-)|eukprot:CAMPEP_0197521736 /NCGR_PEP_ID=MMETSP1318-20131121/6976_1 /TAXON_ID=552666 /ORGANISM="Partenskyella glossopodia, Strain RCC365" /LENGTH=177 /DNA_ID=CAMNT_0043073845 /DNA_START=54 /DNA_END=587 /DNA_ORIENTATION=+